MTATVQRLHTFSSAALIATGVGTWEYDVATDIYTLDPVAAALFGFSRGEGAAGIAAPHLRSNVHPEDLERLAHISAGGAMYVLEVRVLLPDLERSILMRGRQVRDGAGRVTHRRGIVVDVTADRRECYSDGNMSSEAETADDALGAAVDAALAAHAAILAMAPGGRGSLLPIVELLLHELGKRTAAAE